MKAKNCLNVLRLYSSEKVKVITTTHDIHKFKRLKKDDGQLYGITRAKSFTANKFSNQLKTEIIGSKNVSILLTDNQISEIHLKNKTMSTVLTVSAIAVPVIVLVILAVNEVNNIEFNLFEPDYK